MTERCEFTNPEISDPSLSAADLQKILSLQSDILEEAVVSDDYGQLLDDLCRLAESFTPNAVATIMLVDRDSRTMYVENGPSLSPEAIDAFNGLRVGDGSCGNAVFHGEEMYVCNTLEDLRWVNLRSVAEEFSIYSCFSFPIVDREKNTIGSFAISSFEFRHPEGFHKALLETCTSICGVILQRRADDVMRQHVLDEQLKAKKLSSLGVLAGGIAHDFNNLLGTILGNVDLVMSTTEDSDNRESLKWAMKAIDRASDLTQQLLTFSRGGAPVKKPNDIGAIIRDSLQFALHGSNVAYTLNGLDEDCRCILEVDAGQIGQLIQNLALNARQAMPNGGSISVTCRIVNCVDHSSVEDGDYFRIDFSDDGPGIDQELQERIFDPYFTTREDGTGLGLALCYSIVTSHGGQITVASTPPAGTRFSIHLPYVADLKLQPEDASPSLEGSGGGRVIVMDDEEMMRNTVTRILQSLGFEVLAASSGEEVLSFFEQAEKENSLIALTIVDLTVPGGMGGVETKDEILRRYPDARVIVSSGYSENPIMSDYLSHGFSGAVSKPYRVSDLKNVVTKVLG